MWRDLGVRVERFEHRGEELVLLTYRLRRPACFAALTAGELAAIEGVLEERPHRDIARERGVSPRTIANQLASAYRKLGVRGASELRVLASAPASSRDG